MFVTLLEKNDGTNQVLYNNQIHVIHVYTLQILSQISPTQRKISANCVSSLVERVLKEIDIYIYFLDNSIKWTCYQEILFFEISCYQEVKKVLHSEE